MQRPPRTRRGDRLQNTRGLGPNVRVRGRFTIFSRLAFTSAKARVYPHEPDANRRIPTTHAAHTEGYPMITVTPTVSANKLPNQSLSAAANGLVVTSQWTTLPTIPTDLPDGFTCTIINYSNSTFTSNTLSAPLFVLSGMTYANAVASFTLKSGQSCVLTAAAIVAPGGSNGTKVYYFVAKSSA